MSNITKKTTITNLNYEKIIDHCEDEGTIPGRKYLTDELWAHTVTWSDMVIQRVLCTATNKATSQKWITHNSGPICSEYAPRSIPRRERIIQVKSARQTDIVVGQMKKLDGFFEVLASETSLFKAVPTAIIRK